MNSQRRPYLVIPLLIEQPTWGGEYIANLKLWNDSSEVSGKRIGQSYELFGNSKLATEITNSSDPRFVPEFGSADGTPDGNLTLREHEDYITLRSLLGEIPMPLLIKLNQAAGNSFQLHVKPGTSHPRWKPKPESWYFLEDGYISCGVQDPSKIGEYKKTCLEIEAMMKDLSARVKNSELSISDARQQARDKIQQLNPWQYVGLYETKKGDLIDLSEGAVHHSWEENKQKFPLGNVVYEVQVDVMDPYCTIRSFDQGKIAEDGTIREIHIDDYFKFINANPADNALESLKRTRQGSKLLSTPYYSLDIIEVNGRHTEETGSSFHHLFVEKGQVSVHAPEGSVILTAGHSCFIPAAAESYTIVSEVDSILLKTYIES